MDWREYEKTITEELQLRYPEYQITWNVQLIGNLSGVKRQVDILIEAKIGGNKFLTVVDAKMYNKPIDVKDVEEFLGFVKDVGAHRGLMVTTIGYSVAALKRAHHDVADIELDVMSLDEFKAFQAPLGIPFSGSKAIILPAPFGWVIDNKSASQFTAVLYQRGKTFDEAAKSYEWAYFQFWHKELHGKQFNVDDLMEKQDSYLHQENQNTEISYINPPDSIKYPARIRLAKRPNHPALEFTGAVEFEDFIFFIVIFTLPEVANRNLRKLIETISNVLPAKFTDKQD